MSTYKIIIDTDPGIDDAVALSVAAFCEEIDIKLISTVAGNVSVDKTTKNALKLLEFFGKDIPVARGAEKPLTRKVEDSAHIHGDSGMDGYDFPEPTTSILKTNAIETIREMLMASEEKLTLVPIGPLTNIALLFHVYPECKEKIERIVLMGGSGSKGNHTPAAEFNIYADPEAAKMVFKAGVPVVMVGLDVTSQATLDLVTIESLRDSNKLGKMFYSMFEHYRGGSLKNGGLKMHDLCAIAYIVKPELFTTQDCFVDVETSGEYTSGYTVVDLKGTYKMPANATVCLDIDIEGFRAWTTEQFNKMTF